MNWSQHTRPDSTELLAASPLTRSESSGLLSSVLSLVPLCAALCYAAFRSIRCCATSPASSLGPSAGLLTTHIPSCRCGISSSTRTPFWCTNLRVLSTNLTLRAGRMTAFRVRQNRSEHVPQMPVIPKVPCPRRPNDQLLRCGRPRNITLLLWELGRGNPSRRAEPCSYHRADVVFGRYPCPTATCSS